MIVQLQPKPTYRLKCAKKKHENALEFRHQLGARNKQKINEDNFYMIHKLTTASAIMIEVN